MNKLAPSLLALGCLLAPAIASAQTVIYAPWVTQPVYVIQQPVAAEFAPPPPPADAPRFRFGIAGNLAGGRAKDRERGVNAASFGMGLTLDLGVQMNQHLAVYARASASTMVLVSQASLFGVVEYTPTRVLSLGTGIGWAGMVNHTMDSVTYESCCATYERSQRGSWGGVSIPAIIGFNIAGRATEGGRRRALRLGLEGAVGIEPSSGVVGWQAALSVGYVAM